MSLFDTIRFPITSIYNEDEINALPEDLYNSWINRIGIPYTLLKPSRIQQIKSIINVKVSESLLKYHSYKGGRGEYLLLESIFTKQLKQLILDYDN